MRKKLKWNYKPFEVPDNILNAWREIGNNGASLEKDWHNSFEKADKKIKDKFSYFNKRDYEKELKFFIDKEKEKYFNEKPEMATRQCSMTVIEGISNIIPQLVGGSADLSGSNNTKTKNSLVINKRNFVGNYIHYGVREHGMAAIMNGLALYNGLVPYGGTFLIFSDYCKPSIRLSAIMGLKVIYIFSHDSIGLGEDGPTHQPVEQLAGLRSIPNLKVFRPADINETLECWEVALNSNGPSALVLSRQKLKYITNKLNENNNCLLGGYEINVTSHDNKISIIASGSEVSLALEVQKSLKEVNIESKVISIPCQELFDKQSEDYKRKILDPNNLKVSIEAGSVNSWKKYLSEKDLSFGIDQFGKSAPYKDLFDNFNLTSQKIVSQIQKTLRNN